MSYLCDIAGNKQGKNHVLPGVAGIVFRASVQWDATAQVPRRAIHGRWLQRQPSRAR